jgi:hypothetical protein
MNFPICKPGRQLFSGSAGQISRKFADYWVTGIVGTYFFGTTLRRGETPVLAALRLTDPILNHENLRIRAMRYRQKRVDVNDDRIVSAVSHILTA